jgi:PadR family transcriptional regulator, regulatory protein PadR
MYCDPVSKSLEWSRKGYMGMALLLMINEKSMTGYDIMRLMREITEGHWKPTPGGVYPVLKRLEGEGMVKGKWDSNKGRRRKVYVITPEGKRILDRVLLRQSEIAFGINRLFDSLLKDMFSISTPMVAPPSIFTMVISEEIPHEAKELEDRRAMVVSLMGSLQETLDIVDDKIRATKKKSNF